MITNNYVVNTTQYFSATYIFSLKPLVLSSTLAIFFATRLVSLKTLWDSGFTFFTSSILCDVEKVFAKKPGFLPDTETEFLILDKVELTKL
ncbi:hypothetical protein BDGGKGIB_02211 [Nodularia sphaerocarpa UHCC 0038]|nr:hypothetical protein BDGGKGIB_02211 [Nodularia sphaerocarpa UHCC 0038]